MKPTKAYSSVGVHILTADTEVKLLKGCYNRQNFEKNIQPKFWGQAYSLLYLQIAIHTLFANCEAWYWEKKAKIKTVNKVLQVDATSNLFT